MTQIRLQPAEPVQPSVLVSLLASRLRVETGHRTRARLIFLDTFDWRLHEAGARLTREQEEGRETWRFWPAAEEPERVLPADREARFVADLPAGWLREHLEPLVGVRALLPVGEVLLRRQLIRVVDDEGNTTVRLWWEEVTPLAADGLEQGPPETALRLEPVSAEEPALTAALELLLTDLRARPAPLDDLAAAAAARGRQPGDYSSKPHLLLTPEEPADRALRSILGQLLEVVRANLEGVVADLDSEFLHDLRVAVRRTRSALAQLEGVLPSAGLTPFVAELRWLGAATGPCRDLDVFLLDLAAARSSLRPAAAAALAPLVELVESERAQAHADLVETLRSPRFAALVEAWAEVATVPGLAIGAPPIRGLADECIRRAFRRVVKRGRRLGDSPPPEPLHRVRIEAKKLRYLLELFRRLYPEDGIDAFVHELKRLQDLLGGVQDTVVQLGRLTVFASELLAEGRGTAGTLLAAGGLGARLEARQDELRADFAERFAEFASQTSRAGLERLLASEDRGSTCA